MNILLALILALTLVQVVLLLAFAVISKRVFSQIVAFITPEADGKPSSLALTVQAGGEMIARSIVAQAKSTFMGKQSGDVRGEQAVLADIATDKINMVNPALGAILNSFPSLGKTLRRNPALIDFALSKLTGSQGVSVGDNGGKPKFKF